MWSQDLFGTPRQWLFVLICVLCIGGVLGVGCDYAARFIAHHVSVDVDVH